MLLKPSKPDLLIPDPAAPAAQRFLPPEGREVDLDEYWRRRIADGDVIPVEPAKKPREGVSA